MYITTVLRQDFFYRTEKLRLSAAAQTVPDKEGSPLKKHNRLSDEKKCIICLILTIIFGIVMFCTYTADDANQHEGIIRLHVIANSDTASDQGIKLKVRDAVIEHMQSREDITTRRDMEEYITANTDRLERIAEGVVASEGRDDRVKATLGVRYIPEKTYGGTTFPAGNYEALDIKIGDGKGENWWCVLFPPLCLLEEGTDSTDPSDDRQETVSEDAVAGYDNGELAGSIREDDSLTEDQKLRLRWKIQELLQ